MIGRILSAHSDVIKETAKFAAKSAGKMDPVSFWDSMSPDVKAYIYVAIYIIIPYILLLVYLLINLINAVAPNLGHGGGCPYQIDSFGLNERPPLLHTISDTLISVVRSTDSNGNQTGLLASYRNAILDNFAFQTLRIILCVFVLSVIGLSFALGFTNLTSSEILKRILMLFIFLWATNNNNYNFYDKVIDPFALNWYSGIANLLNSSTIENLNAREVKDYNDRYPNNEFIVFDTILSSFFSQTIFAKIGGMIFAEMAIKQIPQNVLDNGLGVVITFLKLLCFSVVLQGLFYLAVAAVWFYLIFMRVVLVFVFFAIEVAFLKVIIVIGVSLFPIFVLFGVTKMLNSSLDKFSSFFVNYIKNMLIKPGISIILLTFANSVLGMILLNAFTGMFSFQVCQKAINIIDLYFFKLDLPFLRAVPPSGLENISGFVVIGFFGKPVISFIFTHFPEIVILILMMAPNAAFIYLLVLNFQKIIPIIENMVTKMFDGSNSSIKNELQAIKQKSTQMIQGAGKKLTQ